MPGILEHILFAKEIYDNSGIALDKKLFFSGNLIPDLAIDKNLSHFRKEYIKGIWVPDMDIIKKEFFNPRDSLKFGIYCHFYLDYFFITEYLIPNFIWDYKHMEVINPRNGKNWEAYDFFSSNGLYRGYNEINTMIMQNKLISVETLESIPEDLPLTGITNFDNRRNKSWAYELYEYLKAPIPYTGEIFDFNDFMKEIYSIAKQLNEKLTKNERPF